MCMVYCRWNLNANLLDAFLTRAHYPAGTTRSSLPIGKIVIDQSQVRAALNLYQSLG